MVPFIKSHFKGFVSIFHKYKLAQSQYFDDSIVTAALVLQLPTQRFCPNATIPLPYCYFTIPMLPSQPYLPKATIPKLPSQYYLPNATISMLLSLRYQPNATVPTQRSRCYRLDATILMLCPAATVLTLLSQCNCPDATIRTQR